MWTGVLWPPASIHGPEGSGLPQALFRLDGTRRGARVPARGARPSDEWCPRGPRDLPRDHSGQDGTGVASWSLSMSWANSFTSASSSSQHSRWSMPTLRPEPWTPHRRHRPTCCTPPRTCAPVLASPGPPTPHRRTVGPARLAVLAVVDRSAVRYVFRPPADVAAGLLSLPWPSPRSGRTTGWSRSAIAAPRATSSASSPRGPAPAPKEMHESWPAGSTGFAAVERARHPRRRATRDRCRPGLYGREARRRSVHLLPRVLDHLPGAVLGPTPARPTDRLLDALVELLVRLHLAGFFWGDCSLSNTLFRLDAGAFRRSSLTPRRASSTLH